MPREFDLHVTLSSTAPLRRFGELTLECTERFVSCQFSLLHSLNGYLFRQWREALTVRDPRGLQEYLACQAEATQDLARQLTEQASLIGCIGRDLARHSLYAMVPPMSAAEAFELDLEPAAERRRA